MALKNTHPLGASSPVERTIKAGFNWVTTAGASVMRNLPLGGTIGIVVGGIILWFLPRLVPEGWAAEAVLSLGMGAGVVLHRLIEGIFGWFIEPMRRHLGAGWEARLRLGKLEGYRKKGLIPTGEADELLARIVRDDVTSKQRKSR
jgi:hypothetical protein